MGGFKKGSPLMGENMSSIKVFLRLMCLSAMFLTSKSFAAEVESKAHHDPGKIDRLSDIKNSLLKRKNTPYFSALNDKLTSDWLEGQIASQNETVFLAVGNALANYEPLSKASLRLERLLMMLKQSNIFVVYDADSNAASLIEENIPENLRMGISARVRRPNVRDNGTIHRIHNPFLRMQTILSFKHIIISDDSILGAGLLVEQDSKPVPSKFYILNAPTMPSGLIDWSESLESPKNINLGISYFDSDDVILTEDPALLREKLCMEFAKTGRKRDEVMPEIMDTIGQLDSGYLNRLDDEAKKYVKQIKDFKKDKLLKKGVVLFGSGRGSVDFEPLVRSTVQKFASFGHAIFTGGEGGFMWVANQEAILQDAYSVGITMGRSKRPNPQLHSKLISADGYKHRIPFLLHKKRAIIFAPGGSGTMKEFATALVSLAAQKQFSVPLLFLSTEYYEKLIDWLFGLDLPAKLLKQIHLIDSEDELDLFSE